MTFIRLLIIFVLLVVGVARAGAMCSEIPSKDDASRGQWFCVRDPETVIVFVHGLVSNNREAWLQEISDPATRAVYWPWLAAADTSLAWPPHSGRKPSIFLAGYYTRPDSGIYRLADAQEQLFRALSHRIDGQPAVTEFKTIVFVAHSLGGVLTRDVLSRHADRFAGKRLGILLLASPSKGSGIADRARFLQPVLRNASVEELRPSSPYLNELDRRFRQAIDQISGPLRHLAGIELAEHLGLHEAAARCSSDLFAGGFCSARRTVDEWFRGIGIVVSPDSAIVYWPPGHVIPLTDHWTISRPSHAGAGTSHQYLRELFARTQNVQQNPCRPPSDFRVQFRMRPKATGASASFDSRPLRPALIMHAFDPADVRLMRAPIPLEFDDVSELHSAAIAEPPFSCKGDTFWAKILAPSAEGTRVIGRSSATALCFVRSSRNGDASRAFLQCLEGDVCRVDEKNPGLAEPCPANELGAFRNNARDEVWNGDRGGFWNVPSFARLRSKSEGDRPGHTEFHVVSERDNPIFDATNFAFGVKANGVPLHFDGRPPFDERHELGSGSRVQFTFAIENLGFNGGVDGQEKIDLEIRYYIGEQQIATASLARDYVAYRHAEELRLPHAATATTYAWTGIYRPAAQANFEVMLEYAGDARWMAGRRDEVDAMGKRLFDRPLVGVVRPPRRENPSAGLIAGIQLENGQIKSLFTREEANDICRWLQSQTDLPRRYRESSYIFEFARDTFSDTFDRGRRDKYCTSVQ